MIALVNFFILIGFSGYFGFGGKIERHARYVGTDSNFKLRRRLVTNRFLFYNLTEK